MGGMVGGYAERFEHWVDVQPDALALIGDDGRVLTYAELEVASNRIANAIEDRDPDGSRPIVAIGLEQGTDAIATMVAIAKTGRTQLPLDPGDPPARLAEVLSRLDPATIVLRRPQEPSFALVPPSRGELLHVEDLPNDAPTERRTRAIDPDGLHLVVFTSGTTGVPKAATRTHQGIKEIMSREVEPWCSPGVRHVAVADHQWLAGWALIRRVLVSGGTIVRYSTRQRGPGELARFIAEREVQHLSAVPSLVRAMLDADPVTALPSLRWVTFTGDILHRDLVVALFDRMDGEAIVGTSYGASELGGVATLQMTRDTVPDGDIVPVGYVNARAEVEIEDPDSEGVGRIIVVSRRGAPAYAGAHAGDTSIEGLADGRWRHRTSDLGLIRPDGMLEIRGRQPHMAKVRGQRVGVSEVEAALLRVPGVRDVGVGVHRDDPAGRLAAWYVVAPGADLHVDDLRRELRPQLPGFMVPAAFVAMPALPRGTRGKLLRDQLPIPGHGRPDLRYPYEAPQGSVEATIADAFSLVLGIDRVGRHDELYDLGGDSLQAAEVMTTISAALGRDLPLSVFVEAGSPAHLAAAFAAKEGGGMTGRFVDLQGQGARAPVYCIHGGGGQVLSLAPLGERLGTDRPLVGIQMTQRDKPRVLFRVGRVAERYAAAIAARQGRAPCIVAGHSYGGVVAQEVSRRLVARGVPVELCVLLDASIPRRRAIAGRHRRQRALGEQDRTSAIKELLYVAHAASGVAPKPHRLTTERMIAALWGMSWHRVKRTPVPIVVMRAAGEPTHRDLSRWRDHTERGCAVVDVPGGHNSMLTPPYVDDLAKSMSDAIDDAEVGA